MKLLYEYAKDYVLENTGLKFLAFFITAVLWLSVASQPQAEVTFHNVTIQTRNIPDPANFIISKYDTTTARVRLRGPREQVDALRPDDLTVYADMTGTEPGLRVIDLHLDHDQLPPNVEGVAVDPQSIRVTVEQVARREAPVKPRFDGNPPSGYLIKDWRLNPSTITISGAASYIRDIKDVSTETISLNSKTFPFSEMVAIDIGSSNVHISDNDRKVMLTVNIEEVRKERAIAGVQVRLSGFPSSLRPIPATIRVTIRGPASLIDGLTPSDFLVSVDHSTRPWRDREVTPAVTLQKHADQIEIISVMPRTIRIR